MLHADWLGGALLLFCVCCSGQPQNPNILVTPGGYPSNVLSLSINTKKYAHAVSDHFLSITLEPATIFSALQKNLGSTTINMARGLSPAYVRISGPECNYFRFQGGQTSPQQSPNQLPTKQGRNNVTVTGWQWSQLNEFVAKTGLDLIVGLNVMSRQQGAWDLSNAVDLISYSDKHGYKMAFQLGNDIQTIGSRVDGLSLGKDATRLRKVLEAFPRYANAEIIGPDVNSCETQEEAWYLKNFITESGPSLSAITYQVPFSSERNVENPTDMFNYVQNQLESRVWQKDLLNKYLGKIAAKKPLWIVESGNKDRKGNFTDGLTWAQRLCAGAKIGINAIMRKPSLLSLSEPTPDYWVSVLHKTLIGPEVLDIKISSGNKTRLETVAHCTKMSPYDPNEGILAPEYRYSRGAVTVFGVNMGTESVKISLKTGEKQSLPLHQYFLTANNRQNGKRASRSLTTMLNGQKLILSPDGELPIVSPRVRGSHQVITVPSQCVFFLVLPEMKSKACSAVQIEESKESYKNGGRAMNQDVFEDTDYDTPILDNEDESVLNEKNTYVAFRTTRKNESSRESKSTTNEMADQLNSDEPHKAEKSPQPESVVKYVTFSNNNWLSKFPKTLKNQDYSEEFSTFSPIEATTSEYGPMEKIVQSTGQSRSQKYQTLALAVAGKRHPEKTVRTDTNSNFEPPAAYHRPSQRLKLVKRSATNDSREKEVRDALEEFANKEKQPAHLKRYESSSAVPLGTNEDRSKVSERPKAEAPEAPTAHTAAVTEINRPAVTAAATALQTTQKATVAPDTNPQPKQRARIAESHVQKIKSRAEQALAKANERNSEKTPGRRSHVKAKKETLSPTVLQPQGSTAPERSTGPSATDFVEKLRRNRQIAVNSTSTEQEQPKNGADPAVMDHGAGSLTAVTGTTAGSGTGATTAGSGAGATTAAGADATSASKAVVRPSKPGLASRSLARPGSLVEWKNGKLVARESRESTSARSPAAALKIKAPPAAHRLGRIKTAVDVDLEQIATNRKIVDRIAENVRDGEKKLQRSDSEPAASVVVSPVAADGTASAETAAGRADSAAGARIRVLEDRIKTRRAEMERKLRERLHHHQHKVDKRSPADNRLIEGDDSMDVRDVVPDRFGLSNELRDYADAGPVRWRPVRRPRSVADFTVKLNEVNTYVDKAKEGTDPFDNEILPDEGFGADDWQNANDIRLSAAEDSAAAAVNPKPKRKSVFRDEDEDDTYGRTATDMLNRLMSQMQKFWKYIKRAILF